MNADPRMRRAPTALTATSSEVSRAVAETDGHESSVARREARRLLSVGVLVGAGAMLANAPSDPTLPLLLAGGALVALVWR